MVNELANYNKVTFIANSEYELKRSLHTFYPMSKVLKAKWFINSITA